MTSSTHGEKIAWKFSGNFTYLSALYKPKKDEKRHELQYEIDPPPRINDISETTILDTTVPVFAWDIHLNRILLPYIFKTFIPMTTLVMTSWISFMIPPEIVPGRAGLLVTLLLVLTTFHLHELEQSPMISSVTPLLLWSELCLASVLLAFLEYAFILYFMRFPKLSRTESKVRRGVNPKSMKGQDEPHDSKNEATHNESTGKQDGALRERKAAVIDFYALRIFPLSFFFILVIYFIACRV